ncbi:N-terminal acetyltransferase A complex catalytic subunit ard1 [Mucor velutinosus]|uniref:N-terminal acetyltransferase A complex catalytic subunit ard1 n=1 Tax=Mucor velutinosus TaxID=708070 RepID=A0AAN7DS62_9FUNG|nr:N-terminal acetyltransferase A complex catalytic subunit ard1 [Mucor velutinosus]
MASLQVAADIVSTISTLEDDLQGIAQAQNNLLEVILKAQASMISDAELSGIKSNMDKVAIYNTKLMSLKATMSMLTGRSKQLKDRAAKLQGLKKKYLSEIDDIRKMEREKDQSIAAKTSTSTPTLIPSPATPSTAMSSPAIPSATCSSTTIPRLVKKKKKTKVRQALIDDGDDGRSWTPKKSLSQQDLALKK